MSTDVGRRGGSGARWAKRLCVLAALMGMTVVFGAWGAVGCHVGNNQPGEVLVPCTPSSDDEACGAGTQIRAKRGLLNDFQWVWANGTFAEFNISQHRNTFSWSYNLRTKNIRSIDRSSGPVCQTPVGSCNVVQNTWELATCDRSGADTCLFRNQTGFNVSFTYGVVFNRYLYSCLGTRINWDGSHVRNGWEGFCSGAMAAGTKPGLTLGKGKGQIDVERYFSQKQLEAFDRACLSEKAQRAKCRGTALELLRILPPNLQRKAKELS